MANQSHTLETRTKEDEPSNGWEELVRLLDLAVVNTPRAKKTWKKLDRELVFWLTHTVSRFPWLNHLTLASVIYSESGAARPQNRMGSLHSFLRWAIPEHYPDVASLQPIEALITYFGDPPQSRGDSACGAYGSVQRHMEEYLQSLPPEERTKLTPFLFPFLVYTPHLMRLRVHTQSQATEKRKEQAFAVVKDLHALVVMGRRRYKWLADLDDQVQQIAKLVDNQQIALPAVLSISDLDNRQLLTFRVWDRRSWVKAHRKAYAKQTLYRQRRGRGLFLQLVGTLPDTPWFLRAAELGAFSLGGKKESHRRDKYLQDCNIPAFKQAGNGLIHPNAGWAFSLRRAREAADGTPEDSRVLFYLDPLLCAAAVGLFALVCLTQSGMRIAELQQVSGDKQCMKIGIFPRVDEQSGGFSEETTKLFFWLLYPRQHRASTLSCHALHAGSFENVDGGARTFLWSIQGSIARRKALYTHTAFFGQASVCVAMAWEAPSSTGHRKLSRFFVAGTFVPGLQWQAYAHYCPCSASWCGWVSAVPWCSIGRHRGIVASS